MPTAMAAAAQRKVDAFTIDRTNSKDALDPRLDAFTALTHLR